jgi:hypothetical protein
MKILPELLKSAEFGGGGPNVLGIVFKIGAKLSDEEYQQQLVPVIIRLFANQDRALRVCLLDNLPRMIERLSQKTINNNIFPQLVGLGRLLSFEVSKLTSTGHRLLRCCTAGQRTDCEGNSCDRTQAIRPDHQRRAVTTSRKDGERRAAWHSHKHNDMFRQDC